MVHDKSHAKRPCGVRQASVRTGRSPTIILPNEVRSLICYILRALPDGFEGETVVVEGLNGGQDGSVRLGESCRVYDT